MTVYVPHALRRFYHDVWQLALDPEQPATGSHSWCQATMDHDGPPGVVAVVPTGGHLTPEWLERWPRITLAGYVTDQPGFIPTSDNIQDAFTTIVRGCRTEVGVGELTRWALRRAELDADAGMLTAAQADVVLQVAIFGKVVF